MFEAPIVQILTAFVAILVLERLRVPLGLALISSGIGLHFWADHDPAHTLRDLGQSLIQSDLWLLLAVCALIIELGRHISEEQNARAIIDTARRWGGRHGRALSLMFIPASIGLIPMPGGALFSAPLMAQAVAGADWRSEWKSTINYWFRHIWEYWWPLYPVVILTLSIFPIQTWQFMVVQIPMTVLAVAVGYFLLIHRHLNALAEPEPPSPASSATCLHVGLPLLIVVAFTLFLPNAFAWFGEVITPQNRKMLALVAGLVAAVGMMWRRLPADNARRFARALVQRKTISLMTTIGGVMIFKAMLEFSGLLPLAGQDLIAGGIPLVIVVAALPFAAGLVTGIAIGFAGASFPLLLGLVALPDSGLGMISTMVLAFGFGYAGMMLSPLHLCFVLSRGYFSARRRGMYRYLIPGQILMMAGSVVLYAALVRIGW